LSLIWDPPTSPPFPYTTLFRSGRVEARLRINMGDQLLTAAQGMQSGQALWIESQKRSARLVATAPDVRDSMMALGEEPDDQMARSEEHTSELQSRENLVCRLLL